MIAAALLGLALLQSPPAADAPLPPSTVALVEAYADGRINYELTSAKPGLMWTPYFPRLANWRAPTGQLPVTALQIARVLVGEDVKVDVSVLLGASHEEEVPVATVVVKRGTHVLVDELRRFGVEPVDLSLANVAPITPYAPTVFSITPKLEITDVTLLDAPYPGYRITLRNLSPLAAANFHVQSYRGEQKALSSIQRGPGGRPALTASGTYTFDIHLTTGRATADGTTWSPSPLDVIEIDSVLWEDGSTDGAPGPGAIIPSDAGRRLQLVRIVDVLRRALERPAGGTRLLERIRAEIDALPDRDDQQLAAAQAAMQLTKAATLDDLTRFGQTQSASTDAAVRLWVKSTVARYESWIARLAR